MVVVLKYFSSQKSFIQQNLILNPTNGTDKGGAGGALSTHRCSTWQGKHTLESTSVSGKYEFIYREMLATSAFSCSGCLGDLNV